MAQIAAIQEQNARNMKDFLQLYNKLTEQCFNRCVSNFLSKSLSPEEKTCTDVCSEIYINYNQRMMFTYMEFQNAKQEEAVKEIERAKAEGRPPNLPGFAPQAMPGQTTPPTS